MDKTIKVKKVADILGVSVATVHNWARNRSLSRTDDGLFIKKQVLKLKEDIENGSNNRLKSRRNKTKIKGTQLSKNYVSDKNIYETANRILETIKKPLSEEEIKVILCEYCLKQINVTQNKKNNFKNNILLNNLSSLNQDLAPYKAALSLVVGVGDIEQIILKNQKSLEIPLCKKTEEDFTGLLYMGLKNVRARKAKGAYYTPTRIVEEMINKIKAIGVSNKTVIDICCGSGNFLVSALKGGFDYTNIFGIDVDEISVKIARFNIAMNTPDSSFDIIVNNIKCMDALVYKNKNFDFCVGNPPWGSVIDFDSDKIYKNFLCAKKKGVDAFALFLEKGSNILKKDGVMYYVVPEALLSVSAHKTIRRVLQEKTKLMDVIFWGDVFDGVQAPAISIMLKNSTKKESFETGAKIKKKEKEFIIKKQRFLTPKNWNINISDEEFLILEKIDKGSFVYLKGNADFALGIVTGNNKKFILEEQIPGFQPIIKGSDIYKYRIEKSERYIKFLPEKFQQVAKKEFYFAKEKLIYRFVSGTLVFALDNKQTLSLNSANIVIPHIKGLDIKYILSILNSSFAHFYFKKKFNSIKVLRKHIESIPIPIATKAVQNNIVKMVDKISSTTCPNKRKELYFVLDEAILSLYNLTSKEKTVVRKGMPANKFL